MSKQKPKLGVASLLASIPIVGLFGVDKFYAGATGIGILQLVLTLTIFGTIITGPWSWISGGVLAVAVFVGSNKPILYPDVEWDTSNPKEDKTYAMVSAVILGISIISGIVGAATTTEKYAQKVSNSCKQNKKIKK